MNIRNATGNDLAEHINNDVRKLADALIAELEKTKKE